MRVGPAGHATTPDAGVPSCEEATHTSTGIGDGSIGVTTGSPPRAWVGACVEDSNGVTAGRTAIRSTWIGTGVGSMGSVLNTTVPIVRLSDPGCSTTTMIDLPTRV